jgi:hypothetical protein
MSGSNTTKTRTRSNEVTRTKKSWRDVVPVHAAADLFPMMDEEQLRELGKDIKEHGLKHEPVFWTPSDAIRETTHWYLLDGRNRLAAMELVGIKFTYQVDDDGEPWIHETTSFGDRILGRHLFEPIDPYEYVLSANVHRRHVTAAQKRALIARVLKAQPEKSDRQIAKTVGVDHKTVGAQRTELESTGEIPQSVTRNGADGKTRKQPAKKSNWPPKDAPVSEQFLNDLLDVAGNQEAPKSALALVDRPNLTVADINAASGEIKKMTEWISEATIPSDALVALNALAVHADELSIVARKKENGQ